MSDLENETQVGIDGNQDGTDTTWGPKLFYGVLIAVLVFFWWMVIYSHGVTPTH